MGAEAVHMLLAIGPPELGVIWTIGLQKADALLIRDHRILFGMDEEDRNMAQAMHLVDGLDRL